MEILYNNLYIHFVLTTLNRIPLISESIRPRIEKYICGIFSNKKSIIAHKIMEMNTKHFFIFINKRYTSRNNKLIKLMERGY